MKTPKFLFAMMAWAALVHGASLGQSGQLSAQEAASGEKSSTEAPHNKDGQDVSDKDQADGHMDHKTPVARSKGATKTHAAIHSAKPALSHPAQSANTVKEESLRSSTPFNGMDFRPTGSTPSSSVPTRTVKRSGPSATASNAALTGQQFKNLRSPGARLASTGGPANSTHNTGAINGSDVKHRP
jgi:hypothetical protein